VCGPATCPNGCCDSNDNCQVGFGGTGGACPCAATCQGCCDGTGTCRAGTIDAACGSGGATCADCLTSSKTCDTFVFPVVCDQTCPAPYAGCATGTTTSPPSVAHGACHPADLQDVAVACASGAQTAECQSFFNGEQGANPSCAQCLGQFDVDFVALSGIYLCAEPFLSPACNGSTACASDCAGTVCQQCSGDATACETAAVAGECATLVKAGNSCVAASASATALCAQASYPNFGGWIAAVGKHYCQ